MVNDVIPGAALYVKKKKRYFIVFVLKLNKCLRTEYLKFLLNVCYIK